MGPAAFDLKHLGQKRTSFTSELDLLAAMSQLWAVAPENPGRFENERPLPLVVRLGMVEVFPRPKQAANSSCRCGKSGGSCDYGGSVVEAEAKEEEKGRRVSSHSRPHERIEVLMIHTPVIHERVRAADQSVVIDNV